MRQNSHFHGLHGPQRETLLRWADMAQWFGMVMLLLTVGLAALTDSIGDSTGVTIVTLCGVIGLLALVAARLIIGAEHSDDEPPH
ncbi:hypothetical protein ACA097_01960 [Pseudomonas sp. QL9]|uniref:Hypothetical membrane protein n=1 Tax=Pseudomonas knackmussii (strain DSM 6978 / CCUG 54928 / LMG 23759 / B13) TaxID=1301098 RepID=A0A024HGG0_PSEKB|nr:hypothetical protein [Pseudomonas knackmussii]CDF83543.1 hypothetical membrane protein [Pseudomonas knackmussii B13]